jgi:hypothetical protein
MLCLNFFSSLDKWYCAILRMAVKPFVLPLSSGLSGSILRCDSNGYL